MRHTLKPHGYIRYGDDFVLIMNSEAETRHAQSIATEWLASVLHLHVHRNNNVVLPARAGLHFLGHKVYPNSPLTVGRPMLRKIDRDVSYANIASYQAMALPKRYAKSLPWQIMN